MESLKSCPRVLLQKLLLTLLIGAGCLVVGIAYFLFCRDIIFLFLSAAVFFSSLARSLSLYRLMIQKRYEMIEGVCVRITPNPLRRYRKVHIISTDGVESALMLSKQVKVKIGFGYRFFFKQAERPSLGSEYLDTALSSDHFLGLEELGEFSAPGVHDEKKTTDKADIGENRGEASCLYHDSSQRAAQGIPAD